LSVISISLANAEQRDACYQLIYDVFCTEMGIMRGDADHQRGIVRDEGVDVSLVFHAELDGELAGTMGIIIGDPGGGEPGGAPFPEHFEQEFDIPRFLPAVARHQMAFNIRFLVKPEHRSSALPFRMIVAASNAQIERGVELVFCFCQPHLLNLYTSLGFRSYAPLFEVQGFGVVVPLVMIVSDLPYMKAIRSPLFRYWPKHVDKPELAARIRAVLPEEPPVTVSTALEGASWSEAYSLLSQTQGRKGPFDGFLEEEVNAFLERSQILECTHGQQIIVKGQDTRPAFVVLEGAVEVRAGEVAVARYQKG
jgi:GNAT superfamily N-acetyltransferase